MFCPNCGAQNPDDVKFCASCGADLSKTQQADDFAQQPQQAPQTDYNYNNNYNNNYNQNMGMMGGVTERNIAVYIILSFVTCGIFLYYWLYCLHEDVKRLSGDTNAPSGGITILLCIVTCGIYTLYWMYKQGTSIDAINQARGKGSGNNSGVLYLILAILGVGIVNYCLMQNELNKIARGQ